MPSGLAAGIVLLTGIAIAYGGLMTPFAARVHGRLGGADHIEGRIKYVEDRPGQWRLHNGLFAGGAIVAGFAPALLADGTLDWIAAGIILVASGLGAAFAVHRVSTAPRTWWTKRQPVGHYWGYTFGSIAGFGLLGVALLWDALWMGILLLAWNALLVGYFAWKRDMPPFAHYVPLVAVGIGLIAM